MSERLKTAADYQNEAIAEIMEKQRLQHKAQLHRSPFTLEPKAIVYAAIAVGAIAAAAYFDKTPTQREIYDKARSGWLSDCSRMGRTVDDCATAWDKSPTLRDVYFENSKLSK